MGVGPYKQVPNKAGKPGPLPARPQALRGPYLTTCCQIMKVSPLTLRFRRDRRQVSVFSPAAGQKKRPVKSKKKLCQFGVVSYERRLGLKSGQSNQKRNIGLHRGDRRERREK